MCTLNGLIISIDKHVVLMGYKKNNLFTLLSIICFILLIRNLFILRHIQPIGYVVDIYSIFPFSFYLTFVVCYLVATFLILNKTKLLGVIILCLNHLEILIIPFMLKYYSMGRADDMDYIGEYFHIATSGHFSGWDIYPASHIIGASISMISSIEAHSLSFIIPVVFSFIFIIGNYLFSRKLFFDSCICCLVVVSSFILYLGIYHFLNVPHALFFAFVPLYLYSFLKYLDAYHDFSLSIIFVLMTLLLPFSHPFIVYLISFVFLFHMVPRVLSQAGVNVLQIERIKVSSFALLIISFMSWFINNPTLLNNFGVQFRSFIAKITEPVFYETTDKLSKIHFDVFDYLRLFGFYYGRYLIPTFFIFISLIYIYFNKHLLKEKIFKNYIYVLTLYFVLVFAQLVLLFNPLISHQPDRVMSLNFVIYGQIPLFSCALYLMFLHNSKSFHKILLVSCILSIIWGFSFFGCLDSPNVYRTNVALTYNEVYGMKWFYDVKDGSSIIVPGNSQINRFHSIFGEANKSDNAIEIADHFGYFNNSGDFGDINSFLGSNTYVIIFTLDELLYQKVPGYEAVGRFNAEDFQRFRKDSSINKIYDSTNVEIFRMYKQGGS